MTYRVVFYMKGEPRDSTDFNTHGLAVGFMMGLNANPECECFKLLRIGGNRA